MTSLEILQILTKLEYAAIEMRGTLGEFLDLKVQLMAWLGEELEEFDLFGILDGTPNDGRACFLMQRSKPEVMGPRVRINNGYFDEVIVPVISALIKMDSPGFLRFEATLGEAVKLCSALKKEFASEGWNFMTSDETPGDKIVKITFFKHR